MPPSTSYFIDHYTFVEEMTDFVLLDCRPFFSFAKNHIVNAVHVNFRAAIIRRRLKSGQLSVADLIPDVRLALNARPEQRFVVYDEYGRQNTPDNDFAFLVMQSLHRVGAEAKLLKGGMEEFRKMHPHHVVGRSLVTQKNW